MWIEVRSNINQFECGASAYDLDALLHQRTKTKERAAISPKQVSVEISILVEGFRCGNKRMDRDLKKALQAERFPTIHFAFLQAENVAAAVGDDPQRLRTEGDLTIAGVTRRVEFVVHGHRLADGRMRARGDTVVQMTDYGLKPPKRFFGLVRVQDQLAVRFDLILHQQEAATE